MIFCPLALSDIVVQGQSTGLLAMDHYRNAKKFHIQNIPGFCSAFAKVVNFLAFGNIVALNSKPHL